MLGFKHGLLAVTATSVGQAVANAKKGECAMSQVQEFLSVLVKNVPADDMPERIRQRWIENPKDLQKVLREALMPPQKPDSLRVDTARFDPVEFISKGWKLLADEQDTRSCSLTEVDFSEVDFLHCLTKEDLRSQKPWITGEEKLARLKKDSGRIRYGATVFMGLLLDYQEHQKKGDVENSVLGQLYRDKGVVYMDFFGDVLESPYGNRSVLYLYRYDDGEWAWLFLWLGLDWSKTYVSAVSPQVS